MSSGDECELRQQRGPVCDERSNRSRFGHRLTSQGLLSQAEDWEVHMADIVAITRHVNGTPIQRHAT